MFKGSKMLVLHIPQGSLPPVPLEFKNITPTPPPASYRVHGGNKWHFPAHWHHDGLHKNEVASLLPQRGPRCSVVSSDVFSRFYICSDVPASASQRAKLLRRYYSTCKANKLPKQQTNSKPPSLHPFQQLFPFACCSGHPTQRAGSQSLTRDGTRAPWTGRAES